MANDHALHRCVTEFMLDTCCFDTKTSHCALLACLIRSLTMAAIDCEAVSSGSSAEFYIEPMLQYVDDIDIMSCFSHSLAIPVGHTPPTELPSHFLPSVTAYEIIDSHPPGFVYLMPSYTLMRNESGFYAVERRTTNGDTPLFLLKHDSQLNAKVVSDKIRTFAYFAHCLTQKEHGPAVQTGMTVHLTPSIHCRQDYFSFMEAAKRPSYYDFVLCMRCLCWPPQAADWLKRKRNHGVPDHITINKIVSNGCDLVGAVHPTCRQHEWMNKHQWRLSFSRAEVTLLNSWTPVQQIIYHMLRYVLKRKGLSATDDKEQTFPKLSNYHIKTLMLWECEQKPQSWWSAESSLIKLCSALLHKLSDWVEDKHCQHYFISNCNLFDHFQHASLTCCKDLKRLTDSSVLLCWFVDHYVCECAQLCPREVSTFFETMRSKGTLKKAIDVVVDWKLNWLPIEHLLAYHMCEVLLLYDFQNFYLWGKLTQMRIKELQNFDPRLRDYYVAVTGLQVALSISVHRLTADFLEELWILFDPINATDTDTAVNRPESGLLFIRKAIKLATLTSVRSSALEMLHSEMSKAYLHHSFVFGHESIHCFVHALLAALYYKSEQYLTAIDHCKQVLSQRCCDQYGSRCIEAESLPQIDGSVDAVTGLILLYRHVRRNENLQNRSYRTQDHEYVSRESFLERIQVGSQAWDPGQKSRSSSPEPDSLHPVALTTHSLACYLYVQCSAAVHTKLSIVKLYQKHLSLAKQPLLGDLLLFRLINMQLSERIDTAVSKERTPANENKVSSSMDTTGVVKTLELVALELSYAKDRTRDAGNDGSRTMDTTRLVKTLELVALENLIRARQVMVREMHCKQFSAVNEFEALYAYRCGLFEECIEICQRYIGVLRSTDSMQQYFVAFPAMLSLLDGELVSVFGIIQILCPNFFFELGYNFNFHEHCRIELLTLLLYLIFCCQRNRRGDSIGDAVDLVQRIRDETYSVNDHVLFDRLILRLTYRSLILFIETRLC